MDPDIPLYSNCVAKLVFFVVQTNLDFKNKKIKLIYVKQYKLKYFQLTFVHIFSLLSLTHTQ